MDETDVRAKSRECSLYRTIDEDGNLMEVGLSEMRDREAAKAFFDGAREVTEQLPQRAITDGLASYPRAIAQKLG